MRKPRKFELNYHSCKEFFHPTKKQSKHRQWRVENFVKGSFDTNKPLGTFGSHTGLQIR